MTAAFFCTDFLCFIALNAIWLHFLDAKMRFNPIKYLLNLLAQAAQANGSELQ